MSRRWEGVELRKAVFIKILQNVTSQCWWHCEHLGSLICSCYCLPTWEVNSSGKEKGLHLSTSRTSDIQHSRGLGFWINQSTTEGWIRMGENQERIERLGVLEQAKQARVIKAGIRHEIHKIKCGWAETCSSHVFPGREVRALQGPIQLGCEDTGGSLFWLGTLFPGFFFFKAATDHLPWL